VNWQGLFSLVVGFMVLAVAVSIGATIISQVMDADFTNDHFCQNVYNTSEWRSFGNQGDWCILPNGTARQVVWVAING
jgi:hypothetical protein